MFDTYSVSGGKLEPYRKFRELLTSAKGESDIVIAVVMDIRGFTSFSTKVESVLASAYLKRVYMKVIDEYLEGASFYKPTGDGLLVVFPCEDDLPNAAAGVLTSFLKLLRDFPNLCKGDDMINFEVPQFLGVGISRGAASKLVSNGLVLDYSGRPLNIASRLMELARPSGLVLDGGFGENLIPEGLRKRFGKDRVYIRGVSFDKLTEVYFTKDLTVIPAAARQMPVEKWKHLEQKRRVSDWKKIRAGWMIDLPSLPRSSEDIHLHFSFQTKEDEASGIVTEPDFTGFKLMTDRPVQYIEFNGVEVAKRFVEHYGLEDDREVTVVIDYVEG